MSTPITVDPLAMRTAMGAFCTGVAVVTAVANDCVDGMTINSLTSISLEPATLLIALTHGARTTRAVDSAGAFTVSILSDRQEAIARHFARRGEDKFTGFTEYSPQSRGIRGALAVLACRVVRADDVADHRVFYGEVEQIQLANGRPLGFEAGRFGDFHPRDSDTAYWLY